MTKIINIYFICGLIIFSIFSARVVSAENYYLCSQSEASAMQYSIDCSHGGLRTTTCAKYYWNYCGDRFYYPSGTCDSCSDNWGSNFGSCDLGCETTDCGVSASASTGGQVCDAQGNCSSSLSDTDQCGNQYVAVPDEGWEFSGWNVPQSTDECTYSCEGDTCTVEAMDSICSTVVAYFTKRENEELCDLYPAHDDYAVKLTGSKKVGVCYEGISVVSSTGEQFDFSFSQTHDPSQNTAAPLDSPWMTAEDWKEFCVNQVMPSQYCFETSEEEEFDPLEPPSSIDPIDPITEDPLDESPDTQDPEDQGEWAINDNIQKMDSNQQKRYEGLTGYLQDLAQKIAGAIDSSKSQNHRDLQTLDRNQKARNDQLISAIKGSKSEFKDVDDTDEQKIADLIDQNNRQYMQEQHDATQGINFEGIEENLPTEEDFAGIEVTDQEVTDLEQGLEGEKQAAVDGFNQFQSTTEVNDIKDKFEVRLINQDCSFTVEMLGSSIEFSFCKYGQILDYMGTIVLFISWVWVLHYVLRG